MADIKLSYPSATTLNCTLTSLASDTNLLSGRQSDVVDNSTNKYLDYILSGQIRVNASGTAPTAGRSIQVYVVANANTTTLPEGAGTTDAAWAPGSANIRNAICRFAAEMVVDNVLGEVYWFTGVSVAAIFGGVLPTRFFVWVVHNTAQPLSSTSTDHVIYSQPVFQTVT